MLFVRKNTASSSSLDCARKKMKRADGPERSFISRSWISRARMTPPEAHTTQSNGVARAKSTAASAVVTTRRMNFFRRAS